MKLQRAHRGSSANTCPPVFILLKAASGPEKCGLKAVWSFSNTIPAERTFERLPFSALGLPVPVQLASRADLRETCPADLNVLSS